MSTSAAVLNVTAVSPVRRANPNKKHARRANPGPVSAVADGIQDRAMLVAITIRKWQTSVAEKGIEDLLTIKNEAEAGVLSLRKQIVRKEALKALQSIESELRQTHHLYTLPWQDDGYRILSSAAYFTYTAKMNDLIEKYHAAADTLVSGYDEMIADAKISLGKLFRANDYPSKDSLRRRYRASISVRPLPSAQDLRIELGSTELTVLRKNIQTELDEQVKAANRSIWERLKGALEHAVERLKAVDADYPSAGARRAAGLRESMMNGIRELLDIIPVLNVTGDKSLGEFVARVREQIAIHSTEELKDSEPVRAAVISTADDILKKMSAFMA